VWEVIATVRDNDGSATEASGYLEISPGLVEAAVSYYSEYRDEIDEEIQLNEAEYERGLAAAVSGARALGASRLCSTSSSRPGSRRAVARARLRRGCDRRSHAVDREQRPSAS
jgi:hypothetical protein